MKRITHIGLVLAPSFTIPAGSLAAAQDHSPDVADQSLAGRLRSQGSQRSQRQSQAQGL